LIKSGGFQAVVTPNFDHLIEHALTQVGGKSLPLVLNEDELHSGLWRSRKPLLVKIHGDFLFNNLANLAEEVEAKLHQNMRSALLRLSQGADLLVTGYSGCDKTIMALFEEMICSRSRSTTKVWWCHYEELNEALKASGLLERLAMKANEAKNAINWLGPWSALRCFESLGNALSVPKPDPKPFGITGAAISSPTHFIQAQQRLAGSPETRSAALSTHQELVQQMNEGGLALVVQEPGAGGSTLLSAIAEAAKERGLYYDARFALRPRHLDLLAHLRVLAWQLSIADDFRTTNLFQHEAVVAIDDLERFSDTHLVRVLESLAQAQLEMGKGALIICTHLNDVKLEKWRNTLRWLPKEDRTYRLASPVARSTPPRPLKPLLGVLELASSGVPWRVALRAASLPDSFDKSHVESWVEMRSDRVALRAHAHVYKRFHRALAVALADALVKEADNAHPLRRMGLGLEAEYLYFVAREKVKAYRIFLKAAEAGLSDPGFEHYFKQTLKDFVAASNFVPLCEELSTDEVHGLASLAIKSWFSPGWPKDILLSRTLNATLGRLSEVERALIQLRLEFTEWERGRLTNWEEGRGNAPNPATYEQVYSRACRSARFKAARAQLALGIGYLYDDLGDIHSRPVHYKASLKWTRRAKEEAARARDHRLASKASDNEVQALLNLERLKTAERILRRRIAELGKEEGFSIDKAVTFGNLFHLALRRGLIKEAEAHFFELVLQNIVLGRWHALLGQLALLKLFARKNAKLPDSKLIDQTIKCLTIEHSTSRF
jgi:hypothetical protein